MTSDSIATTILQPASENQQNIRIFHINTQSVKNKVSEFENFICDKNIDILCLSEHWLVDLEFPNLRLLNFLPCTAFCRSLKKGGGVAILLNNNISFKDILDVKALSIESIIEICSIYLKERKLYVIAVYRPPTGCFRTFLDQLESALHIIGCRHNLIVVGDFNVHFGSGSKESIELGELFQSFGLVQLIHSATRHNNCLDNVFTNNNLDIPQISLVQTGLSDHLGQLVDLHLPPPTNPSKIELVTCRPITTKGKFYFYTVVESLTWNFIDDPNMSADKKFSMFTKLLVDTLHTSFPEKTYRRRNDQSHTVLWFNNELKSMRSYLEFISELYNEYPTQQLKDVITEHKKHYKRAITHAKKNANHNLIINSSNPINTMWKILNNYRGVSKRSTPTSSINSDQFNEFFANVALDIQNKIDVSNISPVEFIPTFNQQTFSIKDITFTELRDIIDQLNNKKSKDPFGFTVELIKTIKNLIISPLTKIINQCIHENIFPTVLKRARVTPIHKGGDLNDISNYRPISILPIFSKIFEKHLAKQISEFFETNNLFSSQQFGFRKGLSTTDGILNLVNIIYEGFEKKKYVASSFCDLSKAFDCVSFDILLEKLKRYNFNLGSIALIQSYLTNRSQTVRVGMLDSVEKNTCIGVPQGSVMGPLLFLIYVNDLPHIDPGSHFTLFADDTTISTSGKQQMEAQEMLSLSLSKSEQWFAANRLFLNTSKTQSMVFSTREVTVEETNNSVKFLGVHLDQRLQWNYHTEAVAKKLSSNTFLLRGLAECVTSETLRHAYFSLCHSHLRYAILVWGHSTGAMKIFSLQRRAVRIIFGLSYRADCRSAFISLKILTLPSIFILENLLYVKSNFTKYYTHGQVHNHNTRNRMNLVPEYRRLDRCKDGPGCLAVHFHNKIPEDWKALPFNKFKSTVKSFLIGQAFYSINEFLNYNF